MQRGRRVSFPVATPLAFVVVVATALLAATFPLTGSPGPEAAQLLSAIGGPAVLLAGAARGAQRHERGFFGDLLNQFLLLAACMIAFITVVTVAGWGNPSCAPGRGYLPFIFLAFPVLSLDSAIGLWIGRLTGGLKIALATSAGVLVAYAAWISIDWYLEPSFRVLTHMLVLIEGDLVRGRELSATGVAYRMATLLFAGGLSAWGMATFPRSKRAAGLGTGPQSPPALLAGAALLLVVGGVVHFQAADALTPDRGDFEEAYSLRRQRGSLVVHADPAVTTVRQADAMLAEGDLWLSRLEKRMGVTPEEDIHVFLHASHAVLGRWTGAEHVHFALPSRHEIHIAGVDVPHSTLGHELAHILGRQIAGGVLGVPTKLGLLPNSGMIEGLAMAMTPELEVNQGLTLREKAAALKQAGLAPPVDALFDEHFAFFRFWRHAPGNAYVTAGALVEALAATTGQEGVARMYREGSLRAAFDSDDAMVLFLAEHDDALTRAELPSDAIPLVQRTLSRPSILSETCDPTATATAEAVRAAARAGDFDTAEALAKDAEGDLTGGTLFALAQAATQVSQPSRALEYLLQRIGAADTDDARERANRLETAGDALWRAGRRREAVISWARVDEAPLMPWHRRLLNAKEMLAEASIARPGDRELAMASLSLLLEAGDGDVVPYIARIAELLGRADAGGTQESAEVLAFSRYLLMRQYLQRGHIEVGLELALRVWESRDHLDPDIRDEVLRAVAIAHARRGDAAIAKVGFETIAGTAERAADRVLMHDRAERVGRMMLVEEGGDSSSQGDRWLLGLSRAGAL